MLTISASDMLTMQRDLPLTDSSIEGEVPDVPSGTDRVFVIAVYDSVDSLRYRGTATADVAADDTVSVTMNIYRVTGTVGIAGTVIEDTTHASGYRYYRFVITAMNIGGSAGGGKSTEMHFLRGDTAFPPAGNYSVVSSTIPVSSILFDNDVTTGPTTGNYITIDLSQLPWELIIDMKSNCRFDSFDYFFIDPGYYKVPSGVSVYCADSSTGPWTQIGSGTFVDAVSERVIPLSYP
jgi:hypothetical protein